MGDKKEKKIKESFILTSILHILGGEYRAEVMNGSISVQRQSSMSKRGWFYDCFSIVVSNYEGIDVTGNVPGEILQKVYIIVNYLQLLGVTVVRSELNME